MTYVVLGALDVWSGFAQPASQSVRVNSESVNSESERPRKCLQGSVLPAVAGMTDKESQWVQLFIPVVSNGIQME